MWVGLTPKVQGLKDEKLKLSKEWILKTVTEILPAFPAFLPAPWVLNFQASTVT